MNFWSGGSDRILMNDLNKNNGDEIKDESTTIINEDNF